MMGVQGGEVSVVVKSVGSKLRERMQVTLYALGGCCWGRCGQRSFVRCRARWMFIVKEVWGRCKSIREFIHLYYADGCIL